MRRTFGLLDRYSRSYGRDFRRNERRILTACR